MIKVHLTAQERQTLDGFIEQIETLLEGKFPVLDEKERAKYGSINEHNKLLVNKTRDYNQNNPSMSSPDVDWTEFEADYQSRQFLETRSDRLLNVVHQMQSAKILHDYDNYQDSLSDYAYSKYKEGANEGGYANKVGDMKQFFNRAKKVAPEEPEKES